MEFSDAALAAAKLTGIFLLLMLLLRLHVRLWLSILAGALAVALTSGMYLWTWPGLVWQALTRMDFIVLCSMIFLIMMLSAIQDASGQSRKLVRGLHRFLDRPRLQLVLFPALVGLLPMPGGALFSCPMIDAAARDMPLSDEKKGLINYWFRHIWEVAWPLYPGYALVCTLLGISMTELWRYTFPMVFLAFGTGWFFFMRDIARSPALAGQDACCGGGKATHEHEGLSSWSDAEDEPDNSLWQVLAHALPIAVTLLGAVVFGFLFDLFLPEAPGQIAFTFSLLCAICVALYQGRGHMAKSIPQLALSRNTGRIMLLLVAIYVFKESIGASGMVQDISHFGDSTWLILLTFIVVPFVSGLLTGIMVGFVGICFPILLGILEHSPLKEYTLPLIVLAMFAGNCGQLLSPLHVCLVVTCEFFNTRLPGIWKALVRPVSLLLLGGIAWVSLLAFLGTKI